MNNIRLGSHNSFSYRKPKYWYMYPFWFMAKCQSKDIISQYRYGVDLFDIRINFGKDYTFQISHGSMIFDISQEEVERYLSNLDLLSETKSKIYVRVLYELNRPKINRPKQDGEEQLFRIICKNWESKLHHLVFFGGNRKYDWKQLYSFNTTPPDFIDLYSSVTGTVLDDWWPWLYAYTHNKINLEEHKNDNKIILMDFV